MSRRCAGGSSASGRRPSSRSGFGLVAFRRDAHRQQRDADACANGHEQAEFAPWRVGRDRAHDREQLVVRPAHGAGDGEDLVVPLAGVRDAPHSPLDGSHVAQLRPTALLHGDSHRPLGAAPIAPAAAPAPGAPRRSERPRVGRSGSGPGWIRLDLRREDATAPIPSPRAAAFPALVVASRLSTSPHCSAPWVRGAATGIGRSRACGSATGRATRRFEGLMRGWYGEEPWTANASGVGQV